METSTMPPRAPRLTAEEENVLVSQVLEIIGGITLEALQTLDQPEERDAWSMEEGDDSVFYSDEDQTHPDVKANTSCEPIPLREDDPEAEALDLQMETKATLQFIPTQQEEGCQEPQGPNTEHTHQSDSVDPGAGGNLTPENTACSSGESLQPNCTNADVQTQPGENISSEKANLQDKEEDVVLEAQTQSPETFDVTTEERRQDAEGEVPNETCGGDRRLEVDQEPERDGNFRAPLGFHRGPSPAYATLPLPKKSARQVSFDHLASSKYSTVSYRKIRRGNTRQKIEEFECMIMNL